MQTWTALLESAHPETSIDRTLTFHARSASPEEQAQVPGPFVAATLGIPKERRHREPW